MTGRGQQGGPPQRGHWRGGRQDAPRTRQDEPAGGVRPGAPPAARRGDAFGTWVEVEELPTQPLAPRPRARVPLPGAIAIVGVVVLLAGGFGLLGGGSRGDSAPPGSRTSQPGRPSAAPSEVRLGPMPRVTPWVSCSPMPEDPPTPILEVNGEQRFGRVEILDFDIDTIYDGTPQATDDDLGDPIVVQLDSVTDIWIDGGSCAVAWGITLVSSGDPGNVIATLESVPNDARDPAIAAQNRIHVFTAPHRGDMVLRAVLVFEDVAVRAMWPIHVPTLGPPVVTLMGDAGPIVAAAGCDLTQRLVTGWEELLNPCPQDVRQEPPRTEVAPGEILELSIEGWAIETATVVCGRFEDRVLVPLPGPPCGGDRDPLYAGVRITGPDEPGAWTLAYQLCATRSRVMGSGSEELCGTWYANLRVRE